MRRIAVLLVLLLATLSTNVAVAEDIAQGVRVVVIDAGHGGPKYPGANYRGILEKNLNLKVALKLGELIESRMPEVKVVYTRKSDMQFSVDLNEDLLARAEIANKAGGDIFISIHANAARSTSARGVETLVMGESPLEQRVNESVLFANNKEEFLDMSNEKTAAVVRAYIQNLQFTYGEYSEMMARLIQKNYAKSGRVARGVKRQPLKVLYATDMPSVLTEIGFMSNPEELKYMTSEKGQAEIAENLYAAVKEYSEFVRKSLLIDESAKPAAPSQKAAEVAKSAAPQTTTPQTPAPQNVEKANVPVKRPVDVETVKKVDVQQVKSEAKTTFKPAETSVQPVKVEEMKRVETAKNVEQPQPAQSKTEPVKPAPVISAVKAETVDSQSIQPKSAAPVKPESAQSKGRAFVVQIMASTTPLSLDDARFGKQRGRVNQYIAEGTYKYKYCVGRYTNREEAQSAAMSLRSEFNGAFVVEVEGNSVVKR